jgi:hypothetical protein
LRILAASSAGYRRGPAQESVEESVKKIVAICVVAAACAVPGGLATALEPAGAAATPSPTAPAIDRSLKPAHGTAPAGQPAQQTMPPGHPGSGAGAPAAQPATVTGKVLETADAGGYTYMRLKTATGETWAAVKQAKVAVGDTVTVEVSMVADGFESKSLKRTFDHLVMGSLAGPAAVAAAPQAGGPSSGNPHAGIPMPSAAPVDETPIRVAKAEGPTGHTVAELWAARTTLKDGKVRVRGKVVKFLPGIMGKNWLHLRDGSGTQAGGDNDITVTTDATAAVGDVVLVDGTLRVDKDFGSGYRYAALIEDAALTK